MKQLFFLSFVLTTAKFLSAQTMDTVLINYTSREFKTSEHILMMFEMLDTTDAAGKKVRFSRSYYFDKGNRMISSVREYYNPRRPKKGRQIIFTYAGNHLSRVTVVPPKTECTNCASDYYFAADTFFTKKETVYTNSHPTDFLKQAHAFRAKFPLHLPWGYFEDEVIVDGRMKKVKHRY